MAISVVSFNPPANWQASGLNGPTNVSWTAGDLLVAVAGNEGANRTLETPTDNAVETLTWTQRSVIDPGGASESEARLWTAEPTQTESGRTIQVNNTPGNDAGGCGVYVISGWGSFAGITGSSNEAAFNQTVAAGDAVIVCLIDWEASATPLGTPTTGSGTATEREDDSDQASYAVWVADWVGTAAGTFDFGISSYAGMRVAQVGLVISPPAGPTITDVETDEDFDDKDTAVTITGTTFEATQGTGKVELASTSDYATATKVEQTVTSWADTAIDFTASIGTLTPGTVYVFVTNNSAQRSAGFAVTIHRALAFTLSASANIGTGGTDTTTNRLTAPAGKAGTDFDAGRRSDDTSPVPSFTVDANDFTEIEWALEATANATADETYQFRVVRDDATALDTYSLTPSWTVGSGIVTLAAALSAELTTVSAAAKTTTLASALSAELTTVSAAARQTSVAAALSAELTTVSTADKTTLLASALSAELTSVSTAAKTTTLAGALAAELTTVSTAAKTTTLAGALAAELTTVSTAARTATLAGALAAELTTVSAAARTATLAAALSAELTTTSDATVQTVVTLQAALSAELTTVSTAAKTTTLAGALAAELTTVSTAAKTTTLAAALAAELTTVSEGARTATLASALAAELTTVSNADLQGVVTLASALAAELTTVSTAAKTTTLASALSAELTSVSAAARTATLAAALSAELTTVSTAAKTTTLASALAAELTTVSEGARTATLAAALSAELTTVSEGARTATLASALAAELTTVSNADLQGVVSVAAALAAELTTTTATPLLTSGVAAALSAELTTVSAAARTATVAAALAAELTTTSTAARTATVAAALAAELTTVSEAAKTTTLAGALAAELTTATATPLLLSVLLAALAAELTTTSTVTKQAAIPAVQLVSRLTPSAGLAAGVTADAGLTSRTFS